MHPPPTPFPFEAAYTRSGAGRRLLSGQEGLSRRLGFAHAEAEGVEMGWLEEG